MLKMPFKSIPVIDFSNSCGWQELSSSLKPIVEVQKLKFEWKWSAAQSQEKVCFSNHTVVYWRKSGHQNCIDWRKTCPWSGVWQGSIQELQENEVKIFCNCLTRPIFCSIVCVLIIYPVLKHWFCIKENPDRFIFWIDLCYVDHLYGLISHSTKALQLSICIFLALSHACVFFPSSFVYNLVQPMSFLPVEKMVLYFMPISGLTK